MSLYLVLDIIVAVVYLALACLAIADKGYRHTQNRTYAIFTIGLLLWLISNYVSNDITNEPQVAIWAHYILFSSSFVAGIALVKLVIGVTKDEKINKIFRSSEPFLWLLAVVFATPFLANDVVVKDGVYAVIFGPLAPLYALAMLAVAASIITVLVRNKNHKNKQVRMQVHTITIGIMWTIPIAALLGYIIPVTTGNFATSQATLLPFIILAGAFYQSAVRHGLFDIRIVLFRSTVYLFTLSAMAVLYVALAYAASIFLFGSRQEAYTPMTALNVILALALALAFQPIKHFFDRLTARVFYRNRYERSVFYADIGKILAYNTNIQNMLSRVSGCFVKTFNAEQVFFYVDGQGFYTQRAEDRLNFPRVDIKSLYHYVRSIKQTQAFVSLQMQDNEKLGVILHHHGACVVLPLWRGDALLGFAFLGDPKGGKYSARDTQVLNSVAGELAIAIQNSLSVEEIRQLNATLKQRVDEATLELRQNNEQLQRLDKTKDEFISMASHQLRTPLTSIKGYIDMVLDGDVGSVNDMQRQMLGEAFMSSERMVSLINDFLNVSRLQTGRFMIDRHPCDLATMIQDEVRALAILAQQQEVKIKTSIDMKIQELNVDGEKLRQVIINMIDNAIYYSHGKKPIQVSFKRVGKTVEFRVRDHGIGVPKEEQSGLFGKFFRATNAKRRRPDGTGVGLFLARKVILAHGGEIIFESAEGEGSTFGFKLPLEQAHDTDNNQNDSGNNRDDHTDTLK